MDEMSVAEEPIKVAGTKGVKTSPGQPQYNTFTWLIFNYWRPVKNH
jgi:hypothetical protein